MNQKNNGLTIAVCGASGLVGSALVPYLTDEGNRVIRLVRNKNDQGSDSVYWNPDKKEIDAEKLESIDAVINLSGENIASGRWTAAKKQRICDSRIETTSFLCETLLSLQNPPKTLLSASAVGFYGDRGEEVLDETSAPDPGFLGQSCLDWERTADTASQKGIRVVQLRIGLVLTPKGGALGQMLLPFKLGVGGVLGSGKQYMSWIAIDDLLRAMHFILQQDQISGPVNATTPNPVTNREFTKTLGRVLRRPTILPVPAFALRILLGEMADALLLSSARVLPKQLQTAGFEFKHPQLEVALRYLFDNKS